MDGTFERLLVSFEQPTSSLHSPVAAMADPRTYVADRDSNLPKTGHFFVASPVALSCMVNCYFRDRLARDPSHPDQIAILLPSLFGLSFFEMFFFVTCFCCFLRGRRKA